MLTTQDSLSQQVDTALHKNPYLIGKKLRFETEHGHVVLNGTVRSFFQKQMAQEAVRRVEGVTTIDNQLLVVE